MFQKLSIVLERKWHRTFRAGQHIIWQIMVSISWLHLYIAIDWNFLTICRLRKLHKSCWKDLQCVLRGIRTITPRTITPRTITPGQIPPGQLPPLGQIPPGHLPPLRNFSSTYLGILCTYILHILFFLEEPNNQVQDYPNRNIMQYLRGLAHNISMWRTLLLMFSALCHPKTLWLVNFVTCKLCTFMFWKFCYLGG